MMLTRRDCELELEEWKVFKLNFFSFIHDPQMKFKLARSGTMSLNEFFIN